MKYILLNKNGKDQLVDTDKIINGIQTKNAVIDELHYSGIIDIDNLELPYHLETVDIIITAL
jgi:hypothetical protein